MLRPGWCGKCYLAKLVPYISIHNSLSYYHTHYDHYYDPNLNRERRNTKTVRITPETKFLSGLLPWWGTIHNAHQLDDLALDLENLTAFTEDGFADMTIEMKALRNVALQNRVALDYLLAAGGGVCHIIGNERCTFIPDCSDNMTHVVAYVNNLLVRQKSKELHSSDDFNLSLWLSSWSWKSWLIKLEMPLFFLCF